MSAILPFVRIDRTSLLARYFTPYQIAWIEAEDPFHAAKKQVFALAEKSVRIGWTFCDGFKNVRKRLRFKGRDYLFVTKDWPSALEYMNHIYDFADMLGFTRAVLSHGEDFVKVKSLDPEGRPTPLTEEVKIGYIKFQNGSRIIAFSSNPYAMAVYGGDVGLDEFAKHPNAKLLWQTAQARVTWSYDMAVWSSHDGEDTLFNQFAQQARQVGLVSPCEPPPNEVGRVRESELRPPCAPQSNIPSVPSVRSGEAASSIDPSIQQSINPWNLYFRVTMPDAVELGLLDVINRTKNANFSPEQFLSDCRARSGSEETYQQSYMCNPLGSSAASIVEWSAIERCREDYEIERIHLESETVLHLFGQFNPDSQSDREAKIHEFLCETFADLLALSSQAPHNSRAQAERRRNSSRAYCSPHSQPSTLNPQLRLGFDVAASGQGDLAVIYIDEVCRPNLRLRALFSTRTEDWHFLKTVLFFFFKKLPRLNGAGDESGLGRQICWEAASKFGSRFLKVNFGSKKQDLGFALMNQLSVAEKRFPRSQQDVAADFFALRKSHTGTRWIFSEGRNNYNSASHCDIAWAGALATYAHTQYKGGIFAATIMEDGTIISSDQLPTAKDDEAQRIRLMMLSDDPRIWRPWR
jgi:phage FluMu gp28-like protein